MEKIKRSFIFAAILLLLGSCGGPGTDDKPAVISGAYLPSDDTLFLHKLTINKLITLDSALLAGDGNVTFTVDAPDYGFYNLSLKGVYPLTVILKNGEEVTIRQTGNKVWPYQVEGGEECMLLVQYLERLNRDYRKVDSLSGIFHNSQSQPDFLRIRQELNEAFSGIHDGHIAYAREFVAQHPSSMASVIVLNGYFREFPIFNHREDFEFYEMVDQALLDRMPENEYVKEFHRQVGNIKKANEFEMESEQRLSPGRLVPEFELESVDGLKAGPGDYKGKKLLIYFWAGADARSRQVNPLVRKAYEYYHPLGLEMMAISFDRDRKVWESAVRLDSLPGLHLCDLKGAGSPVQRLFNLKMKLPVFYLIDEEGYIYAHDRDFSIFQRNLYPLYAREE